MLISIITITYNSQKTITETLNSVFSQTYKNIEHIIVDGNSYDHTRSIIEKYKAINNRVVVKYVNDKGIFDAMNIGLAKARGGFVTFLNSDDIFNDNTVVEKMVDKIKKNPSAHLFYGDVPYFSHSPKNITRYYSGKHFVYEDFSNGLMPPHPGSFIKTSLHKKIKFNTSLKIAGDFDLLIRIFNSNIKSCYINKPLVRMRTGGNSGKNLITYLKSTIELLNICRSNNINTTLLKIILRIPAKLSQFLIFDTFQINKSYKKAANILKNDYMFGNIKIISKTSQIPFHKNFVLSAMNLAFLGNYFNGTLCLYKELVHWPDGIFSRSLSSKIDKIPGRALMDTISIPKRIKKIHILGNANRIDYKFLKNKFKSAKILHTPLMYGSAKEISRQLPRIQKNTLILLTLPTPKQEQLAYILSQKNSNYQIICLGASLAMLSGNESQVPKFLYKIEFLWRLKKDTGRRLARLFQTTWGYFFGYSRGYLRNLKVMIAK